MSTQDVVQNRGIHLGRIGQIAITVSDLARSKDFYQNKLGLRFLFDAGTLAFFQCGDVRVMLGTAEAGAAISPSSTIVYFKVDDLQQVHEQLTAVDVPFLQNPLCVAKMHDHDLWIAFLTDPDKNPIGLMSEVPHAASVTM